MQDKIKKYLYFGYAPEGNDLSWVYQSPITGLSNHLYTQSEVSGLFDRVMDSLFATHPVNHYCIVPLSGGWDSRILLGAALDRLSMRQIKTLSFGTPGQLDFDVGCKIAKKIGLEHHAVDLSRIEWNWNDLVQSAKVSPWTYVPDSFFNRCSVSMVAESSNDLVLSGFMGDPLTGGHFSRTKASRGAIAEFVSKQRRVTTLWLPPQNYKPKNVVPLIPDNPPISYSELVDIGIRQSSCIAPIVTPQKKWKKWGADMGRVSPSNSTLLAPFADPVWASYWLGVPKKLKSGQRLYLDMMKHKYPKLAAMPSKYTRGLAPSNKIGCFFLRSQSVVRRCIHRSYPRSFLRSKAIDNYLDYQMMFLNREDCIAVILRAINVLKCREATPWLDLDVIWQQHYTARCDHSQALLVLLGLAVNLEANNSVVSSSLKN